MISNLQPSFLESLDDKGLTLQKQKNASKRMNKKLKAIQSAKLLAVAGFTAGTTTLGC